MAGREIRPLRGGTEEKKKRGGFAGWAESVDMEPLFSIFAKMKMGKKWEDFFEKVWYNAIVDDGS